MKLNSSTIKDKAFRKTFSAFPQLLSNYQAGNEDALFELAYSVCIFHEYLGQKKRNLKTPFEKEVTLYFKRVYEAHITLVISDSGSFYKFTRKQIAEFLRGEGKHAASDTDKPPREALHRFVFENHDNSKKPFYEFAITWNWIIYPGARCSKGNNDSGGAFIHCLKLKNGEINLTLIESILINIAHEIWSVITTGMVPWSGKIAIKNDLESFRSLFGDLIIDQLLKEEPLWMEWLNSKAIRFA